MEAKTTKNYAFELCTAPARLLLAVALMAGLSLVTGCKSCKPGGPAGEARRYDVKFAIGDSLKDASFPLDVVGINPTELQKWQTYPLASYFKDGDPVRQDALRKSFAYVPGKSAPKTFEIKMTDPIWEQWTTAGVKFLVVMANLPIPFEGKPGSQDPRRQLVPLCYCYWPNKTTEVNVQVQAGGLKLLTPTREGWQLPAW